jgi:membrane fusion protein (multidrug efflux system)
MASVVDHGKVPGFSASTGSAFSLLPAQNAAGSWVKVVQRLLVRVSLDLAELKQHSLHVCLSMQVDGHVKIDSGSQLGSVLNAVYQTKVFDRYGEEADAEVARIGEVNASVGGLKPRRDENMRLTPLAGCRSVRQQR